MESYGEIGRVPVNLFHMDISAVDNKNISNPCLYDMTVDLHRTAAGECIPYLNIPVAVVAAMDTIASFDAAEYFFYPR